MPTSIASFTAGISLSQPLTAPAHNILPRQSSGDQTFSEQPFNNHSLDLTNFLHSLFDTLRTEGPKFEIPSCYVLTNANLEAEEACSTFDRADNATTACFEEEGVKQVECWCKISAKDKTFMDAEPCAKALCKDKADVEKVVGYFDQLLRIHKSACEREIGGNDESGPGKTSPTPIADASTSADGADKTKGLEEANGPNVVVKTSDAGRSAPALTCGWKNVAFFAFVLSSFYITL